MDVFLDETFLDETIDMLKLYDKTPEDVLWVGCATFSTSWLAFEAIAKTIEYCNCGSSTINEGLVVVGNGWYLKREHDGCYEKWEFKTRKIRKTKVLLDQIALSDLIVEQLSVKKDVKKRLPVKKDVFDISNEVEDFIEQMYWDFVAERDKTYSERDVFKQKMRRAIRFSKDH